MPTPAAAQAAADVVIDGPPVTVELAPEETKELTFEWDVNSRLRESHQLCSNTRLQIFDPDSHLSYDFGCNVTANPTPTWRDGLPFDTGPVGDPGTYTIRFTTIDNDGGSHPATITFRLLSFSASSADPITPGGGAGALPALGERGAVWLHFDGTQGHDLALQTAGEFCYWRYRVRRPGNRRLVDEHRGSVTGCDSGGQGVVELGELPETGTYRIELVAPESGIGPGTARLVYRSAPETCRVPDLAPIVLVHGFNGNPADWDIYRPILVAQVTQEFRRAGLSQADAAICGDLFVHAVAVEPRANSHVNGALLASRIDSILERTGAARIDIIAHSKGGLDSRRAIQLLGEQGAAIRNVMMIATPNRGTLLADIACGLYNLSPLEPTSVLLTIANEIIESAFGPCDGPEDALYVITEDYVEETFNRLAIDRPGVVYRAIAGNSACPICLVASPLLGPNDMFVPVDSVPGPAGRYPLIGLFERTHDQLLETDAVIEQAYCGLTGRRQDPVVCAGAGAPDAPHPSALTPAGGIEQAAVAGGIVHIDGLRIGGASSRSLSLPIGGLGNVGVAVVASSDQVSAAIGGQQLVPEQTELGHTLTTELASPNNVNLTISNAGSVTADVMVLVFGADTNRLSVDHSPQLATPGEPVEIRVPGVGSPADLEGVINRPDGSHAILAFADDGDDAVASFTPATPGDHLISVIHTQTRRRVAASQFVARTPAASLPGSFAESLATNPDGLATALHIDVDVEVAEPATYRLTGFLTTVDGTEVGSAESSADLIAGGQQIRLTFSGPVLFAAGEDGPYRIDLTLLRMDAGTGQETIAAQGAAPSPTAPHLAEDFAPAIVQPGYTTINQRDFDTVVAEVPVTLSEPVTRPITVDYASLNPPGEQYAHSPEDFQAVSGTLTFLPGETSKSIPLIINGDPGQQGNKLAVVGLTDPTNATIDGSGQGGVAILAEPTAVVDTPVAGLTWSAGEQISFSGHVQDPVDGLLPAATLHWRLRLEHCPAPPDPFGCHTHQLQEWHGVAAGSFTAPDHGYPAHLELELTAEGPSGLTHHAVRELHPDTVQLTISSNPPGRLLAAGFAPAIFQQRTPYTLTAIQGSTVLLSALTHQENGTNYAFQQWSNGGPVTQSIQAPAVATTYTATFVTDRVTINAPSSAAGQYPSVAAAFGPKPGPTSPARSIVVVNDGTTRPTEGCGPLVGFPAGAIALVDRGTCPFNQKVRNAQGAGASAVIVVNNQPGDAFEMGGTDPAVTIPSVMVSAAHGATIRAGLPATGTVTRVIPTGP